MRRLALAVLLLPLAASAQPRDGIDGGAGPLYTDHRHGCYVYGSALVLTFNDFDALTSRTVVKRLELLSPRALTRLACEQADSFDTIYEIEEDDAFVFFYGLRYPYLFLDAGTGPENRGLDIINVESGETTFRGTYWSNEPVVLESPDAISFFRDYGWGGPPCPIALEEGWGEAYGWAERVVVNVRSGDLERTGEMKCGYRM